MQSTDAQHLDRVDKLNSIPFVLIHLVPLLAFFTGVTLLDVAICAVLYISRVFFLTGVYHRYFAHRGYSMNRVMQFLMAAGGCTALQKGPLWWAGHHRHHHKYSDQEEDSHSPKKGFWWSHVLWILVRRFDRTPFENIPDFAKYPELRWLGRFHYIPPILLGVGVGALGYFVGGGWERAFGAVIVGFFLSTVLVYHVTFMVNSLAHVFGSRRFATSDTSRNNWWIALLTGGEGWHNNHHHYPSTANQGFFWYEIDWTYYILKSMSLVGLVRDLKLPPKAALERHLIKSGNLDVGIFTANWERAVSALQEAQQRAGQFSDESRKKLEEFVVSTKARAEALARGDQAAAA